MEVQINPEEQEFVRTGMAQAAALAAMIATFYNALKEEGIPGSDAMRLTRLYGSGLIGIPEVDDDEEV